jgi:large subunit ribosomal protein L21
VSGEVKIGGKIMKYAIVADGGKQYKAVEGETIEVDRLHADVGDEYDIEQVLLIADDEQVHIGSPLVSGAKVKTTIVDQVKGPKVVIFKYIPKKRYRVKKGHRQQYTRLRIDSIAVE